MSQVLEVQQAGLRTISLNRPERRNAMSAELLDQLNAALQRAAADPGVRAVLLRGEGECFCVGGDVKAMAASGPPPSYEQRVAQLRRNMEAARWLHEMQKPTIAAIRGAAAGAGLSLALACDFRIAGRSAKITTAFAKVGLSGDFGGTWFLTQIVGSARARELYLTSPILDAQAAHAIGLVTRVVDDDEVDEEARKFAEQLAEGPTVTLGYMKRNLNDALKSPLEVCLDNEAMRHVRCSATEDHREAAQAFVEKRKPVFQGK